MLTKYDSRKTLRRAARSLLSCGGASLFLVTVSAGAAPAAPAAPAVPQSPAKAPFPYVWGKAYHILPETHSDESGYFSIVEGLDGKIYVGTAKYNLNSYLVEFDPRTETQKIVIDTHKVVGQTETGYAAQSKIHTRNFVGPSGTVYVGSQEGYRKKGDVSQYPGGYAMTYDPKTGIAQSLGMPYPKNGVIDVVADEGRGLLYIVTTANETNPDRHWMLYDLKTKKYRELGPLMTPYASTLIDKRGHAHSITRDFQICSYDPDSGKVTVRDLLVDGKAWEEPKAKAPPNWRIAADGRTAYLIMMRDSTLLEIDLLGEGDKVLAKSRGKMIEANGFDSRGALTIAPDGRVYALGRVRNETGFGRELYLHHLLRYDPATGKNEDLGVLAVKNPDFFDFGPRPDGTKPPWSGGYRTLPDGTLTPSAVHQGLIAAKDGTFYALLLNPYTLFHIDGAR